MAHPHPPTALRTEYSALIHSFAPPLHSVGAGGEPMLQAIPGLCYTGPSIPNINMNDPAEFFLCQSQAQAAHHAHLYAAPLYGSPAYSSTPLAMDSVGSPALSVRSFQFGPGAGASGGLGTECMTPLPLFHPAVSDLFDSPALSSQPSSAGTPPSMQWTHTMQAAAEPLPLSLAATGPPTIAGEADAKICQQRQPPPPPTPLDTAAKHASADGDAKPAASVDHRPPLSHTSNRAHHDRRSNHSHRVQMFTIPQTCVLPLELRPYAAWYAHNDYPYYSPMQLNLPPSPLGSRVTSVQRRQPWCRPERREGPPVFGVP